MSTMSIGRVGGLAVALGVGAAALSAAGVAWADAGSADQSGTGSTSSSVDRHASKGPSSAGRASRSGGSSAARSAKPGAARSALKASAPDTRSALTTPTDSPADTAAPTAARNSALRSPAPVASQTAAAVADYQLGNCTDASTGCTFVLSPSGVSNPAPTYTDIVMNYYVLPNTQIDQTAQPVATPEGAYPVTGVKSVPIAISVPQGQTILEQTIERFAPGPQPTSIPVTIFGYSQSAIISSLIQRKLEAGEPGYLTGLDPAQTSFVTVGQEMIGNGGWYARFPGLDLPSLGWTLYGATPENAFPTTNYALEYDGFADSPRYPGNVLSDINAALGILLVHINYANPKYFANVYGTYDPLMAAEGPGYACQHGAVSCTKLPTTDDTQAYYFIQTPNLPLLAPIRAIPFIGNPLADLVQPFLKVIVDLGYADPAHGYMSATQPYANVALPFQVFPRVSPIEVLKKLVAAIPQGIHDFAACLHDSACRNPASGGGIKLNITVKELIQTLPLRISAAVSAMVAPLLSTVDLINASLLGLPYYNLSLVAEGLQQAASGQIIQGLINAVMRPIVADIGMNITFIMSGMTVWLLGVVGAITGCGPGAPTDGLCIIG